MSAAEIRLWRNDGGGLSTIGSIEHDKTAKNFVDLRRHGSLGLSNCGLVSSENDDESTKVVRNRVTSRIRGLETS
ncbi:hypothetical protein A2U01_0044129 [Trifolium medium]|uniref:Uncharacterized protein n=1 Tax=Trifolium medium TaxID=97028 RepID=A0A392QF10_9FABA|nr:hypothetical protein [Trifolium medium]